MNKPDYKAYNAYIKDLNVREISNSETYDKSLLTLSSAFLGLSLTFINNVVSLSEAGQLFLLYFSWALFALTIVITISSFIYSQWVIRELKERARKYFLEGKTDENERSETLSKRQEIWNLFSGVCFILAVLAITTFISLNVMGGTIMNRAQTNVPEKRGQPVPSFDQAPKKPPQEPSQNPTENSGEQPVQPPKKG